MKKILSTNNSYSLLLLRVTLGIVLGAHGVQKAFGWFNGFGWSNSIAYFNSVGLPTFMGALVILIETLGAFLLIIGFAGRINAALMGIVMAGAFFIDHLPNGFYMNWYAESRGEGFEFDILFWAIAAVITVNGSGAWSADRVLMRRSKFEASTFTGISSASSLKEVDSDPSLRGTDHNPSLRGAVSKG